MDKILIDVKCPATSKSYDFWVSKKLKIHDGKMKMIEAISGSEKCEDILDVNNLFLYTENENGLIDEYQTFEHAGIKSGDTIMLI
ncbi:MAG: hypothetical protein J6J16_02190 [Lachnospiraceae bacterium]|nr:hypothetical protein [Lachnospiraceae bacterium]